MPSGTAIHKNRTMIDGADMIRPVRVEARVDMMCSPKLSFRSVTLREKKGGVFCNHHPSFSQVKEVQTGHRIKDGSPVWVVYQ
ncbi:hypothetical protein MACH01_02970 [Thalassospira tepidiphila]|nr:hypothetical protein MACH01_02970 [Thalassospira tepidiphila]